MFVHMWYSQSIYLCTMLYRYYQPIQTPQHALRACLHLLKILRAYIYVHCCTGTTRLYQHYSMLSEHVVHMWYSQGIYLCKLLYRYYQHIHTLQHTLRACLYTCDTLRAYIYIYCSTGTTSLYKHYSMLSEHVCTYLIFSWTIFMYTVVQVLKAYTNTTACSQHVAHVTIWYRFMLPEHVAHVTIWYLFMLPGHVAHVTIWYLFML